MSNANYEPYVRATALKGMDKALEGYSLNLPEILDEVGIDPNALNDSSKLISIVAFNSLLNLLEQKTSRHCLGLELVVTARNALNNIGPLALILKLGDTTGECVENGLKYLRYHTNGVNVEIFRDVKNGVGEFRYTPLPPLFNVRHLVENALGVACTAMRFLISNENQKPIKITFQHTRPHDTDLPEKFFSCPIEYNAQFNSMIFDLELLNMETLGSDSQVSDIVFSYLQAEIEEVESKLSLASSVAVVVGQLLPSGRCSMELVAKGVALHPKTLQRRLNKDGTSYSKILDKIRMATAVRLLSETKIPAAKVAKLCGYSSPGSFNLAFKDRKKITPGKFRENAG